MTYQLSPMSGYASSVHTNTPLDIFHDLSNTSINRSAIETDFMKRDLVDEMVSSIYTRLIYLNRVLATIKTKTDMFHVNMTANMDDVCGIYKWMKRFIIHLKMNCTTTSNVINMMCVWINGLDDVEIDDIHFQILERRIPMSFVEIRMRNVIELDSIITPMRDFYNLMISHNTMKTGIHTSMNVVGVHMVYGWESDFDMWCREIQSMVNTRSIELDEMVSQYVPANSVEIGNFIQTENVFRVEYITGMLDTLKLTASDCWCILGKLYKSQQQMNSVQSYVNNDWLIAFSKLILNVSSAIVAFDKCIKLNMGHVQLNN